MRLQELTLVGFEQSWSAAFAAASAWIPSLSGSFDSRIVQLRGRELLAAFILVAINRHGTIATMETVRDLIDEEVSKPGSILKEFVQDTTDEVREVSTVCLAARGCWFGDAVPFLALNIHDDRASALRASWPKKVLSEA
jgi:hypothetical protein